MFLCDGYGKEERPCNNTKACHTTKATLSLPNNDGFPEWSDWSEWSQCSCFSLSKYRRRYCRIVDPAVQGFCAGPLVEQKRCEPASCQSETGDWSPWSEWSRCSRDCGDEGGYQVRNRMCSNPLPANGGSYCAGYSFDQRPCQPEAERCNGSFVDGKWGEWQPWSPCSDKCINGQRSRTRYCSAPRPANGGKQCVGSDFEIEACGSEPGAECSVASNSGELGKCKSIVHLSPGCLLHCTGNAPTNASITNSPIH